MSNDHISVEHLNNFDAILPDSSVGTADVSPPLKSQNQTKQLQSSASEWSKEGSLSEDKSCQDSSLAQCSQGEIGQDESLNQNNIKKILNNGQDKNLQFCMSSNSLNFDGQIKAEDEQVGQLQRSSSHQVKSGSLLSSQKNSSNNVAENLSTTSNSSMLATMSKQKTIKNWSSSKALMGGGQTVKNNSSTNSYHKNASIIGKLCQERQSESNSNSKKEDENEDNDANKSEDNSLNENSQKPQRKMIFIKKSMVKVANTQSTELQKMDFQDDDLVDHDEQAYLELSKSYNIEKSISLSIHSLIVTQK